MPVVWLDRKMVQQMMAKVKQDVNLWCDCVTTFGMSSNVSKKNWYYSMQSCELPWYILVSQDKGHMVLFQVLCLSTPVFPQRVAM